MPIPSLTQQMYDEGRDEGREEMLGTILRERFGPDARIPAIAHRLASLPDDRAARLTITAADLDELAEADG